MSEIDGFLLSKINELERKVFELEKRLQAVEERKIVKTVKPVFVVGEEEKVVNTRVERYLFNGESYKKSKLVLAVIKKFVKDHPGITESQLSGAFPSHECKCSYPIVKESTKIPVRHLEPVKRYFTDDEQLIKLADGTIIAVCTQWGQNIQNFIEFVKKYGYKIEKE